MNQFNGVFQILTVLISALGVTFALYGAFRAGVLRKIQLGAGHVDTEKEIQEGKEVIRGFTQSETTPYEIEQLAQYYGQILSQSKISFWFSLVFASLGFTIIIVAVILYTKERVETTVASFIAGTIIDSVSALFFIQSKNAQKAMGEFFDKLRHDHQQLESRKICESIDDVTTRDAIRLQLSLYLAQIPDSKTIAESVIKGCLIKNTNLGS